MNITRNVYVGGEIVNGKVMPSITTHTISAEAIETAQKVFENMNAKTL